MIRGLILVGVLIIENIFVQGNANPSPGITCPQTVECTSNQIESCEISPPFYFDSIDNNNAIKAGFYTFYLATSIDSTILKSTCEFKNGNNALYATNIKGDVVIADSSDQLSKWGGGALLFCPGSINQQYTSLNCKFET